MRTLETIEAKGQPSLTPPERLKQRLLGINRLFLLTVLLPTGLAILYYGFMASDIYISESRFVVRSPQKQAATSLGALLQGAGFTRSQDDTYTVQDFIASQDALRLLDQRYGLATIFGSGRVDRVSRFGGLDFDTSFEALHHYYQRRIVRITSDSSSSITTLQIRAFRAEDARNINASLLEVSEHLVNQLSERARQDVIQFSLAEVAKAEARAKAAALALSAYRNKKGVFDPEKQSTLQLQQVSRLQDELIAAKTRLAQITLVSKNNPQVAVLEKQVEVLQAEIAAETARVVGGERSLSGRAAGYERLALERGFADKQLAAALASLEQARNEAQRKQLYLERIVQPSLPDRAAEPKRLRAVLVSIVVGMIFWGILTLLITGVREHHE